MSSNTPCAACKFQRRKCTKDCIFAPYFPPEDLQKFVYVHKVFGGSNVAKILSDLHPSQREEAARSLAYEARGRLMDPIYGCVGVISHLQQRLKQIHAELSSAREELATYIGPNAFLSQYAQQAVPYNPAHQQQQQMIIGGNASFSSSVLPYTNLIGPPSAYVGGSSTREQQQQQQQLIQMMGAGGSSASGSALPYTSLMPYMMGNGVGAAGMAIREQQLQQNGAEPQQYGVMVATATDQPELVTNYALQNGVETVESQQYEAAMAAAATDQHQLVPTYALQQLQQNGVEPQHYEAAMAATATDQHQLVNYLAIRNSGDHHYEAEDEQQKVWPGLVQMPTDETGGSGRPYLDLGVNHCNQIQQQQQNDSSLQAQLLLQLEHSEQELQTQLHQNSESYEANPRC